MKNLVFMLSLVGSLLIFLTSCNKDTFNSAPIVNKTIDLPTISGVSLESSLGVTISQGETQVVTMNGYENLFDLVNLKVENGVLKVALNGNTPNDFNVTIDIVVPTIQKLATNSSGGIAVNKFANLNNLKLDVNASGSIRFREQTNLNDKLEISMGNNASGDVKFDGMVELLDADLKGSGSFESTELIVGTCNISASGSGDIQLTGSVDLLDIQLAGSGSLEAFSMIAKECKANMTRSGSIQINLKEKLDIRISGSGDFSYKGNPQIIAQDISGSGRLINAN